jgi:methylmalonyl-CoA mutase N-terminal domain/subunit
MNNIVRVAIQSLAAVLAGVQSVHSTSYDEAYCLPTEASQKLAIRTQQIIAYETRVVNSVDPLGGSYLVERMTDDMEERIWEMMKVIEKLGGFIQCFKKGWVEQQLNEARYEMAEAIEIGELPVVGVNIFRDDEERADIELFSQAPDMQAKRIQYVVDYKKNRDQKPVKLALKNIHDTVKKNAGKNMFELIYEAVASRATLQEICDAMREASDFAIPS